MKDPVDINKIQLAGTTVLEFAMQMLFFKHLSDDAEVPLSMFTEAQIEQGIHNFTKMVITPRNEAHDLDCNMADTLKDMNCMRCVSDKFHRDAATLLNFRGFVPE